MDVSDWARKALSEFELTNLMEYTRISYFNTAHMLSQNPKEHVQSSSTTTLCTLIKNNGLLFSLPHNRWFVASECLHAQGFPTPDVLRILDHGIYKPGALFCSFNNPRMGRKSGEMKKQAGNSMAIPVCGIIWIYILGFMTQLGA